MFYHDCTPEDVTFAKSKLNWQAMATLGTPAKLSDDVYGKIKKYYIYCTDARDMDKIGLTTFVRCEQVLFVKAGHSPFLSIPDELAAMLSELYYKRD